MVAELEGAVDLVDLTHRVKEAEGTRRFLAPVTGRLLLAMAWRSYRSF